MMTFASFSWLDAVLVLLLMASIAFGYHQGIVRQFFLIGATYVATVLAAQYYEALANWVVRYFPVASIEMAQVVSFIFLTLVLTLAATKVIWMTYCETKLPSVIRLDGIGGALLGGGLGVVAIDFLLVMVRYSMDGPWPEGSAVKEVLHMGLVNSTLQEPFISVIPMIYASLLPWLPAGIPALLTL